MTPKAILAICAGYGAGIWFSIDACRRTVLLKKARKWPSVLGEILESTTYKDPGGKSTNFRIRYRFAVGETIEGATPRLSGEWFWNKKQQAAFVARFVAGQHVEVFYDPCDPKRNCLDRDDRSGIAPMWIMAVSGVVMASLLLWLKPDHW